MNAAPRRLLRAGYLYVKLLGNRAPSHVFSLALLKVISKCQLLRSSEKQLQVGLGTSTMNINAAARAADKSQMSQ